MLYCSIYIVPGWKLNNVQIQFNSKEVGSIIALPNIIYCLRPVIFLIYSRLGRGGRVEKPKDMTVTWMDRIVIVWPYTWCEISLQNKRKFMGRIERRGLVSHQYLHVKSPSGCCSSVRSFVHDFVLLWTKWSIFLLLLRNTGS